uniref:Uncharacterized protein n=1 Tax=Anguilla anguilla TaxID=7936 RepID=A0A0E9V966_ANGAN
MCGLEKQNAFLLHFLFQIDFTQCDVFSKPSSFSDPF